MAPTAAEAKARQSTIGAMVAGFDPSSGPGIDKLGPIIALGIYVTVIGLLAFDVVPNPDPLVGLIALLGPVIGGWAGRLGAK